MEPTLEPTLEPTFDSKKPKFKLWYIAFSVVPIICIIIGVRLYCASKKQR